MVCVDRKKLTCICGCSLTQATAIFGVIMVCGVIFSGLTGGYGFFGFFQVIMGIMMIVVCCIPYNVQYRRILYISYIIFLCIELLLLIIVVILVLAVDDLVSESCDSYSSYYYSSYYSSGCAGVDDALRTWYIIVLVVWACIYIPVGLIGLQIVYWGWKEQDTRGERKEKEAEKKKDKKEAKNAMQMQQQQQMMMMQQQQQPGQYPMVVQQPGQVPIGQPMTA